MVINVALCEDCMPEGVVLAKMLDSYRSQRPDIEMEYTLFHNAEELLHAFRGGQSFKLLLLDILMPGIDGLRLSRELREAGFTGGIIFITATRDYAYEAFGVNAMDYLLKPVKEEAFFQALDHAAKTLTQRESERYAMVHMTSGDRMVRFREIVCVEVRGHTHNYYLENGEMLKTKVLRVSFSTAAADLIADPRFIQPHQSFLVNADFVSSISKKKFILRNSMEVPISRLRYTQTKAAYMQYLTRDEYACHIRHG